MLPIIPVSAAICAVVVLVRPEWCPKVLAVWLGIYAVVSLIALR